MFATFTQLFKPKNRDIQKKILFTLGALFIFKLGTAITVPGVNLDTKNLGFLDIVNAMSGGAFEKASIFALGVMPYITASIVIQLLSMDIVPYLSDLRNQGGVGRNKLNQITRVTGIILAFFQGYLYSFAYIKSGSAIDYMTYSMVLTAGTCLLLWIGDQVTAKGIGNGISLIIMAGIITTLPNMFVNLWNELIGGDNGFLGLLTFILFVASFIAIIVGVIYTECAERRLPIQYANKSTMSGNQNYIPFKLNSSGVMPVIFASAPISIIQIVAQVVNNSKFSVFQDVFSNFPVVSVHIRRQVCSFEIFYNILC